MPIPPLHLPTEQSAAGDLARQIGRLVGPAVDAGDSTLAAAEYLALSGGLDGARTATASAVAEATPQTASALLSEWEEMLAIPLNPSGTDAARQATILARLRSIAGSPEQIVSAASTLQGSAVTLTQYLYSAVTARPSAVFRFTLLVTLFDSVTFRAALDELLQRMAPAHTTWGVSSGDVLTFDTAGEGFDEAPFGS